MISGEEIREEALKREMSAPKAMQGSFYYGFREGAKWMQHKCFNKISELTEQLDASHVFCEGVKERYIKKACNFLCDTCHASYANDCKTKPCELKIGLIEAMKGE